MSSALRELLAAEPFVVLDGALATELEARGADLQDPLWSAKILIEQPRLIREVHRDYFAAGADVATTATYQASFAGFERRGIDRDEASRLMRTAVTLAVDARDAFWEKARDRDGRRRPLVAASIGPFGAMLADGSEYHGRYSASDRQLREFHAPRIEALLESGCDLFACETIPCLREAVVLAELLDRYAVLSGWISFSCADGECDSEGEALADCVATLDAYRYVAAVGVNCTRPRFIEALLRGSRPRTTKPLLAYPNSGEVYDAIAKHWHDGADAGSLALNAGPWLAAGARLLGGCCRTTPADIHALHRLRRDAATAPPSG